MNRIAFSVVIVGLGVASGLLVSSGLAEQAAVAVVRGKDAENITALRKQRLEVLRESVDVAEKLFRNARIEPESFQRITVKMLNAELDLAPDRAARIALRERTVEKLKIIEETTAARKQSALAHESDVLEAKAARLQAEIDLLIEKADGK